MRIRHYSLGKFYLIECPEGSRVVRDASSPERLAVPFDGRGIMIPAEPCELLPMLAEAGRCGLALIGEPVFEPRFTGLICPSCAERETAWLTLEDDGESALCERCSHRFIASPIPIDSGHRSAGHLRLNRGRPAPLGHPDSRRSDAP